MTSKNRASQTMTIDLYGCSCSSPLVLASQTVLVLPRLPSTNVEQWREIIDQRNIIDPDRLPNLHQTAGKLEILGRSHDEFVSSLDIIGTFEDFVKDINQGNAVLAKHDKELEMVTNVIHTD